MFARCLRTAVSQSVRQTLRFSTLSRSSGVTACARDSSAVVVGVCRSSLLTSLRGCPMADSSWRRNLHTPGDKELEEFLKDEIKMEKQQQKSSAGKLPKIKGFEISTTAGPNVILSKMFDNETITVKFNVNNSIDDSSVDMEGDVPQQNPEQVQDIKMMSKPAFIVEVSKGGDKKLALHCVFPVSDEYTPSTEHEEGEPFEDVIEIQDVALLSKSQEWTDDVYSLSASVMDGNLYDMMLKLLEERGIDADFVDQLIEFSTSYEHNKYVDTLEQLKDFVSTK